MSRCSKTVILSVVVLLFPLWSAWAANSCRDSGPLVELVARSDLIAVVSVQNREVSFQLGEALQGSATLNVTGLSVRVEKVVKRPFLEGYDFSKPQHIHHPQRALRIDEVDRFFVFLVHRGGNTWLTLGCGLLPIDARGRVHGACEAIDDLFGRDRFLRERMCLLSTPAVVELSQLEKEIDTHSIHAHRYQGHAEVVQAYRYQPKQTFQRVVLRVRGRNVAKLLSKELARAYRTQSITLTAYLPTEQLEESEFEREFRKGRRLSVNGVWFNGTFVLDEKNQ